MSKILNERYSQTFLHEAVARSARLCWTHTQSASLMQVHSELYFLLESTVYLMFGDVTNSVQWHGYWLESRKQQVNYVQGRAD